MVGYAAALCALVGASAFGMHTFRERRARMEREIREITRQLGVQYPDPVSVSPDGRYLLLKYLDSTSFELRIIDRAASRVVYRHHSTDRQMDPVWRPDSRAIAFLEDRDGNQEYRVAVWDLATGSIRRLAAPPTQALCLAWSPDGSELAYVEQRALGGSRILVLTFPAQNTPTRALVSNLSHRMLLAWSPDGKAIATTLAGRESGLLIVPLDGQPQYIGLAPDAEVRAVAWLADRRWLVAALQDNHAEVPDMVAIDIYTRERRQIVSAGGDVTMLTPVARGFAYQVTAGGRSFTVLSRDPAGTNFLSLGHIGGSTLFGGMSADGDTVFSIHLDGTLPPAFAAVPLRNPTEWHEQKFATDLDAALPAQPVRLTAADGLSIPAYLWSPNGAPAQKHALILVHGGPALQTMATWDGGIQTAVRAGFVVLALNYRGSTGFGASYEQRGDDLDGQVGDVIAACEYAHRELHVATPHIVLWGHSYGALLVSRAVATRPDIAGRAILISLVPDGDQDAVPPRGAHVPSIYLFQGAHDALASAAVARKQLRGVFGGVPYREPFETHIIEDEGHSFRRLRSWAAVYAAALAP